MFSLKDIVTQVSLPSNEKTDAVLNITGLTIPDLFFKCYIFDELSSTRLSDDKSISDGDESRALGGGGVRFLFIILMHISLNMNFNQLVY